MAVPYVFTPNTRIKSSEVNANFQGLVDGSAMNDDVFQIPDGSSSENISGATNTSWADIGTGFSITTVAANSKVWVNFIGYLSITHATGSPYWGDIKISVSVGGSGQEGTFFTEARRSADVVPLNVNIFPIGFTVPVTVATAGATTIKLRGIKVLGTSYTVVGKLSAFATHS